MNSWDASCLAKEINKTPEKLNPWEKTFMKSVEQMVSQKCGLTDNQGKCLEKIYRKVHGG